MICIKFRQHCMPTAQDSAMTLATVVELEYWTYGVFFVTTGSICEAGFKKQKSN